jgi:phosphoglycerol transferase MdoB-like AlkP superfamily enzyme
MNFSINGMETQCEVFVVLIFRETKKIIKKDIVSFLLDLKNTVHFGLFCFVISFFTTAILYACAIG